MLYYVRVLNMFKTQDTPLFYQECTIGVLPILNWKLSHPASDLHDYVRLASFSFGLKSEYAQE